jgi:hypothetical protein
MDGPGFESRWGVRFLFLQNVTDRLRGPPSFLLIRYPGVRWSTTHLHIVRRLISGIIPPPHLFAIMTWTGKALLLFASVIQIFRSCGLHGALLKPLTDGLNVGRISNSDAGTHSWLPLLTAVRVVIEIMPLSLQNETPIPVAEFSNISRLCFAQLGSVPKEGVQCRGCI